MTDGILHIGLVDFAEPTLLILGDAESLSRLADRFASRQTLDLVAESAVMLQNVKLLIDPVEVGGTSFLQGERFTWRITQAESERFAEQLHSLAASEVPAHAYLESIGNASGIDIVVSKGEYDTSTVFSSRP